MQSSDTGSITRYLFKQYYDKPQNADGHHYSSHWRQLHKDAKVVFDKDNLVSLTACGFGDLQNHSIVYLFFSWITIFCYLAILQQRNKILALFPAAMKLSREMGLNFTYDAFRQVCALAVLEPYLKKTDLRIMNIGDGYGFLSALIKKQYPQAKISLVDLGKTLLFQAHYCQRAFPQARFYLVKKNEAVDQQADFVLCPAEDLEVLGSQKFDVALNIASMQEMNSPTIKSYFDFLRQTMSPDGVFYCCNRQEKVMPGGEVSRLAEYPWQKNDKHLLDEVCPWYRFFLSSHRARRGPTIANQRVLFVNYFDGTIAHRLTQFNAHRQVDL